MKFIQTVTITVLSALHAVLPARAEWTEVNEVRERMKEEYYGYSLALSSDFLAVGAPYDDNEFGNENAGAVHIYKRTEDNSLTTTKILYGQSEGETFGFSMDIASKSNILVVGAPMDDMNNEKEGVVRTYVFDGGWDQLGQDILGRNPNEEFGQSVTISDDGHLIAIGGGKDEETAQQRVDVYSFNLDDRKWDFVGEIRIPDADISEGLDPVKLDMVQNGDEEEYYLAVSSGRSNKGKGVVMVFQITSEHLDGESERENYELVGRRIVGEKDHDEFGDSISLGLYDGIIYLAVGVPCTGYYDDEGEDNGDSKSDGRIEVFTFETASVKDPDATWKLSATIDQIENEDGTGEAVVISRDGMRLVIGSPKFNEFEGAVRVFDFHKDGYSVVGEEFFLGEERYQGFGSHLAMHELDIVVTSPYADYVKMYRYDGKTHYEKHLKKRRRSGFATFILVVFIMSIIAAVGYCIFALVRQGRIRLPSLQRQKTYNPAPTIVSNINQNNPPRSTADNLFAKGGLALPQQDQSEADDIELMGARKTNVETKEMV